MIYYTLTLDKKIEKVFPELQKNYKNHLGLSACAILAATYVNAINFNFYNASWSNNIQDNRYTVMNYPNEILKKKTYCYHISQEWYDLRILLINIKGPTSFGNLGFDSVDVELFATTCSPPYPFN